MKETIPYWQAAGFIFVSVLGTALHFLFNWTQESVIAALFSAVNESIWEHMKLLFYPMILFAVIEYRFWGKTQENFWCIKLRGILLGLAVIPVVYYTYTGILGVSADWFNITIFFIAAAVSLWAETKCFQKGKGHSCQPKVAVGILLFVAAIFTIFTFAPPSVPFFRDPISGTYGFFKK